MLKVYHCRERYFLEMVRLYFEKKLISYQVAWIHLSCRFRVPLLSLLQEVCKFLKDPSLSDKLLLQNVFQAINVYYNYSGQTACFDMAETATKSLGHLGWNYQVCALSILNCSSVRFLEQELIRTVKSFSCQYIAPDVIDVLVPNVIMKQVWQLPQEV